MINLPKKIFEMYSDIYLPKKKEKFDNSPCSIFDIVFKIVAWIIMLFAAYLSLKCKNKFDIADFVLAVFFPPFYIIYHMVFTKLCGLM
jgi:hypothetical protein